MRANDLDFRVLLKADPEGGILRFAAERALLFDAAALGLLRKELIQTLGFSGARGLLTRFGYAHGFRTAERLKSAFDWVSEREWRLAGARLQRLQGLVVVEPVKRRREGSPPLAQVIWRDSYEAEQHLLHVGRALEPVCWTLAGFASGYTSGSTGGEVFCIEEECRGQGDPVCRMVGRPRAEWGERLAAHLPFYEKDCLDEALRVVTHALKQAERKLRLRKRELARTEGAGIVARSVAMEKVVELAERVAHVDSTILVTGEGGVGKEVLARFIHDQSERRDSPFVPVNCSVLPETLLESELFGHTRGAFPGAVAERPGLFEAAAGGTIFLDEISDLPAAIQVKLLRVLEEHALRRLGENRERRVDVRVIAATNRELYADVSSGRFRRDLFYRLRVVELRLPPLRERRDDVLPLARALLASIGEKLGRKVSGFTSEAARQLLRYSWPGNVRELANAVERAVVLANGKRIDLEDLSEEVRRAPPVAHISRQAGGARTLAELERETILAALRDAGGNKTRAAAQLGIGTATLFRKLKSYAKRKPSRGSGE